MMLRVLPVDGRTVQRLATLVTRANAQTGANPEPRTAQREFSYGGYVDEVVAYQQTVNGVTKRYCPHYNHLYSVAALTDTDGIVVERYKYDAYGKQTVTGPTGVVRAKSAVGLDRGFTGYITDNETCLLHVRARQYSTTLGFFIERDPWTYVDGFNQYLSVFVPDSADPYGLSDPVAPDPFSRECCLETTPFWKIRGYNSEQECRDFVAEQGIPWWVDASTNAGGVSIGSKYPPLGKFLGWVGYFGWVYTGINKWKQYLCGKEICTKIGEWKTLSEKPCRCCLPKGVLGPNDPIPQPPKGFSTDDPFDDPFFRNWGKPNDPFRRRLPAPRKVTL